MPAEDSNPTSSDPPTGLPSARGSRKALFAGTQSDVDSSRGFAWKKPGHVAPAAEKPVCYEHYEVLCHPDGSVWELGRGAMGITYKALDTRLQHTVALKVVSVDLTGYPAARERFLREARTAARLHHPNIARVFHLGETNSGTEAFYAMEFVQGETLEARVRRAGPLSVWLVLEVGIEVARALVAACHQDLIHRDLKPANLMLVTATEGATVAAVGTDSSRGEASEAWVKVIDFGLAKAAAEVGPLTGAGDFIGTPAYASPEQFSSKARGVDGRSDIYSLGGTLWYALTGKMPFEGNSFTEIERQKRSQEVRPAQLTAVGVPLPLGRLLTSMLAADPGDRPQTPSVLLEAFRRCREELRSLAPARVGRQPLDSFSWVPFHSFKHRRIYQVSFGYAVGAWVVLQFAAIVLPGLDGPSWIMRPLIATLVAGFGEALLVGWALDRQAAGKARLPQRLLRRVGFVLLALVPAAAMTAFFLWHSVAASNPAGLIPAALSSSPPTVPTGLIPPKSIAVLPFENLSAAKDSAFFADGVQDEILTDLAKVADLQVTSRTSVAQYKSSEPRNLREIAAQLRVAYVLEGSVQRTERQVRVTVELINARTDAHLWAEHYDRPLNDVFVIQSDIAQAIANQLQARLSPEEKAAIDRPLTTDLAAYDFYLRARALQQEFFKVQADITRNAQREILLLDEAVRRDPKFTLAYCDLAGAHDHLYSSRAANTLNAAPVDHRGLAEAALAKARRLQPDAGEVHLAQATHFLYMKVDLDQARIEADLAQRALPGNARAKEIAAIIARGQSRWDDAVRSLREAVALEPRATNIRDDLAHTYRFLRRYEDYDRAIGELIAELPERDATDARIERAAGYLDSRGDVAPLRAVLAATPADVDASDREDIEDHRVILALCSHDADALDRSAASVAGRTHISVWGVRYPLAWYQALAARMRGDRAKEQSAFAAARGEVEKNAMAGDGNASMLSLLAVIDAGLGHDAEAVREAKQACELAPVEKFPLEAVFVGSNLAVVYAWTGQINLALDELEKWKDGPVGLGQPMRLSYGDLRLNPLYDPLRGNHRFAMLVEKLAPGKAK